MNKFQEAAIKRVAQTNLVLSNKVNNMFIQIGKLKEKIKANEAKVMILEHDNLEYEAEIRNINSEIEYIKEEINTNDLPVVKRYGKPSSELVVKDEKGHWQIKEDAEVASLPFDQEPIHSVAIFNGEEEPEVNEEASEREAAEAEAEGSENADILKNFFGEE